MYVAKDSVVYLDQLHHLSTPNHTPVTPPAAEASSPTSATPTPPSAPSVPPPAPSGRSNPLIVLIPVRAGLDKLNQVYVPAILDVFRLPQSLGIVGGKPNASLYIIATQGTHTSHQNPYFVAYSFDQMTTCFTWIPMLSSLSPV